MPRVRVLRQGLSQRVGDTDEIVYREIGEIVEVSDLAFNVHLGPDGYVELVEEEEVEE